MCCDKFELCVEGTGRSGQPCVKVRSAMREAIGLTAQPHSVVSVKLMCVSDSL